eukprot:SAG31_NODE_756_length_12303_cov_8.918142_4_plen_159_part_00
MAAASAVVPVPGKQSAADDLDIAPPPLGTPPRPEMGRPALVDAAAAGDLGALRAALAAAGVDLEARDQKHGNTAFIWACAKGHAECITALAEAGCDTAATTSTVVCCRTSHPAAPRLSCEIATSSLFFNIAKHSGCSVASVRRSAEMIIGLASTAHML